MTGIVKGTADDLATLSELTESTLLEELQERFTKEEIYTYIGDILLAVNPYKQLDIYSSKVSSLYKNMALRSEHKPHIFAVADRSYTNMFRSGKKQCCVVCGESGSGKTESTKFLVKHIVQLCDQKDSDLLHKIVELNPLLEAFGNAQTVMNNNSSRFGKYVELHFDGGGRIMGASISDYLLEKCRVIQQAPGERNFHIFYYLFAGMDQQKLKINLLTKPDDHRILKPTDGSEVFGDMNVFSQSNRMWIKTQRILDIIGFDSEQKESLTAILTSIIHLTDIKFNHDPDTDGSYVENEERLEIASHLLGVEADALGGALTTNKTNINDQEIVILKNTYQASDGRDALAKALYEWMFTWIIKQINAILRPDVLRNETESPSSPSIGILDIYGFENFKVNSFEQMCINMANEQLQYYFNLHIFQLELDEYSREGVKGVHVKYDDNKHVIDLFYSEKSIGLYKLLDDESLLPQATDLTFVDKLGSEFKKRPEFQRVKTQNLQFVIQHYAGPVSYCASGFLEKNRDLLSATLLECVQNSESPFVVELSFGVVRNGKNKNRRSVLLDSEMQFNRGSQTSLKTKQKGAQRPSEVENRGSIKRTLSGYFLKSLADLTKKMLASEPHFVRCIRPNASKSSDLFDRKLMLQQLSYTGVLQMVIIRRQGYAVRLTFGAFLDRYKIVCFPMVSKVEPGPNNCKKVLVTANISNYEIGKAKVFLKYYHTEALDSVVRKIASLVTTCQKHSRGVLARKTFRRMKTAERTQRERELTSLCRLVGQISETNATRLEKLRREDREFERSRRSFSEKPKPNNRISQHNQIIEEIVEESMSKVRDTDVKYWGKLHIILDNKVSAKFLLLHSQLLINNSETYDGRIVGLKSTQILDNIDPELLREIGEGVCFTRDSSGNIFAKKLSKCEIIIRGYRDVDNNCLSDGVISALGRMNSEQMLIFEMLKFKMHLAKELFKKSIDIRRLEMLSLISFSFNSDRRPFDGCFAIVNFSAIDLLGNIKVLPELKNMAGLNLSPEDDFRLQTVWSQMRRRPSVE